MRRSGIRAPATTVVQACPFPIQTSKILSESMHHGATDLWGCVCFSNGSLRPHAVVFRCALASRCGLNCDCSRAVLSEACPSVSTCQPGINERFCIVHPTMLQKKASPSARKIRFMRKSWLVCRQGNTTKTLSDSMSRNSENRGPRSVDYFNGKGIALFDQRYQLDAFGNLAKAGVLTVEMSG